MNRIEFINQEVRITEKDINIILIEKMSKFDIYKIKINNETKTKLEIINHNYNNLKIDIEINTKEDLDITEISNIQNTKIRYTYNLDKDVELNVNKFLDGNILREQDIINLEENSKINFNLKTIALDNQVIELVTNHKGSKSEAIINNKGVTKNEGNINLTVTNIIPNGIKNCIASQKNRIVPLNDEKNVINPILLIDEYDVEADHAAFVGPFNKQELFYLQSRGINKKEALNLLIKGFLKEEDDRIIKIINKHWK